MARRISRSSRELLDLVDAELDAEPVGEVAGLLASVRGITMIDWVEANHRLEAPIMISAGRGVAFWVERVQVRVAAPARCGSLRAPDRALGFGHAAPCRRRTRSG